MPFLLCLVAVVENAIVSDREGNWNLHVAPVEDSMPIFTDNECINYLRYGSQYLEQIKVMEFTYPQVYQYWRFPIGKWVVRDHPGWFCSVCVDIVFVLILHTVIHPMLHVDLLSCKLADSSLMTITVSQKPTARISSLSAFR